MVTQINRTTNSYHGQGQDASAIQQPDRMTLVEWLSLALLIGTVILFPERPAWGAGFDLNADNGRISGYAQRAPLGSVLGKLAEDTGYTIYIDETLYKSPTTFNLPSDMPAEKAIKRMVHPHSYALVFSRVPGQEALKIDEIKVYAKGNRSTAFLRVDGGQSEYHALTSHARGGYLRSGDGSTSGVRSGMQAVRSQVKAPVNFTQNAMGFKGFQFKDRRHGPDYRPNTVTMARAYAQFRQEQEALALRAQSGQMQTAKQSTENQKNAHRSQRSESIQQTMQHTIQ